MVEQYYSQAHPHLIGNITVWGTNKQNSEYIQPLIRVQKKLIRIIKKQPPLTHTAPIMTELELLNIPNLYVLRVGVEVHTHIYPQKQTQTDQPEHNHHYISTAQIHNYPTRHSQQQHHYIPNQRKKPTHHMEQTTQTHTAIWNTLLLEIRTQKEINKFKKTLKQHLLKKQKE